ncbi:hypothetical protein U8D42_17260 [Mycobacterium europaeum]|uniref:hypothetical protein n=1 Tax=Mycobacterium europaeum TaxID=761804 RepID=UPI002AE05C98|nr:hypothetical protein [Mycobacterium europaeum]MEA1159784.1 hypothetical protein [Mycobacterium europaeum]
MFDQAFIVDGITRWTDLGIKFPKKLATAIETFDAIRCAEPGHRPVFDLAGVTPANAEAKIRSYAEQLVPTLGLVSRVGAVDLSALDVAKQDAVNAAARDVLVKAAEAVPGVIEQVTPEFDRAASEFTEAVSGLPDDLSDAAIVQAGPAVLGEYQRAAQAQTVIGGFDHWIASLRSLPGLGVGQVDPVTRVLRPVSVSQLSHLDNAQTKRYGQLNPLYVVAVREGVEFALNTPQEAAQIRAGIEARGRAHAEREHRRAIA